jgi:hypothetical protein
VSVIFYGVQFSGGQWFDFEHHAKANTFRTSCLTRSQDIAKKRAKEQQGEVITFTLEASDGSGRIRPIE